MEARQRECQQILQDGLPTFVPTFSSLKAACLECTCERIRRLDTQLEQVTHGPERDALLDQAAVLLQELEKQFRAIVDQHQLEDPDFAAQRGISLTHFNVEMGKNRGPWKLLTSNRSAASKSITESDPDKLTSLRKEYLKEFCGGAIPRIVAFKRLRTLLERQYRAVAEDGKLLVPNAEMKRVWFVLLGFRYLASFCFLGVGIIATTTFSGIFVKYFFWISILWILASSSLLVGIVRAFGGNGKDCMSAFLAAVGIWLVVIQIGQTKLNGQLGVKS